LGRVVQTRRVPLLLLVVAAIATFVVGIPNGALTTLVIRRFAEMVISLLLVLVLTDILRDDAMQQRFVHFTLILGGLSAAVGIVLYLIPDALAMQALSTLRVFDYPTGPEVLRYVRDDPELLQRATGLWIDPNAFGGYLLMTGALCLPQVFTAKPVLPRWLAASSVGLIGLCLVLTVSRGAMIGFALAGAMMGVLRYRRLLLIGGLVIGAALLLPQTRELVSHFVDGFLGQDLATQMRFGEYKDALRLIERYPLLGVGFTGSPDIDLYVGVSSMYLLIMQQMGILGATAFVMLMAVLGTGAVRVWPRVRRGESRTAVFLGAHGALAGALFSGIFDHYFFNIDFHNSVLWLCACLALAAASQLRSPE
jgi:polysaccharide biosynthesis protein PslJ